MRRSRAFVIPRVIMILGLCLAAVTCASSSARAGCGSHTIVVADQAAGALFEALQAFLPEAPGDQRLPCSGPSCSRNRNESTAPVAPHLPRVNESWGLAITDQDLASVDVDRLLANEARPRPRRVVSFLERPPRLSFLDIATL